MNKEKNLPMVINSRLPIEQKRNLNRIIENFKRTGKITLNAILAFTALGVSSIGGPIVAPIGLGISIISATNVGKDIIFKKANKNSMFVTKKNLKGEISLYQESTNLDTLKKMKGLKPQEKAALMGLELLVGLQNYKQKYSDQNKKTEISKDERNNVFPQVFTTVTHGINIKTIEALDKLGYLQIEEKTPGNKSILLFEKIQFKQYDEAKKAIKAKLSGDKNELKQHQKQMYKIKFKLTDKTLDLEDLYKKYAEMKFSRGDASTKRIGIILEALKEQKIDVVSNELGISEIKYGAEQSLVERITRAMENKDECEKFRKSQVVEIDESVQQEETLINQPTVVKTQSTDKSR